MRFPNPVAVTCPTCGQPTVLAETSLGSVRVHCGTWRTQCDTSATEHRVQDATRSVFLTGLDTATDQDLAA
ncbi:MAG: hypothetical protein ACRDTC_10595 [Pseudonocardiaceae bacterium]